MISPRIEWVVVQKGRKPERPVPKRPNQKGRKPKRPYT